MSSIVQFDQSTGRRQAPANDDGAVLTPDSIPGLGLLAASPDCVKVLDAEGVVRFVNDNGCRLLEVDGQAAVVGQKWDQLWPESARPQLHDVLRDAAAGVAGRFTGMCPNAKGRVKWWDVSISPIPDLAGKPGWFLAVSRDISKEKHAETLLQDSEVRFRTIADNISQLAWMADGEGHIFWYNQRWFDYTGTTLDQMAGWGWKSVHHPDHVDRVIRKIKHHFETGEVWEDTFPLRGADGKYRWFLSQARPIRNEDGEVTTWFGTNTDISEQRSASQRLRQKARLIELSHEAIIVWDVHDGIVLWNRGCEDLYGYSQAEALGAFHNDLLHTRHPVPLENFLELLTSQGGWTGELRHIAKDGSEVWVESRQELVRIGGRDLVLETNRDITERRRSDELRNVLIGELNHRVKNTLAIVQSLASQSARNAASPQQFVRSFNGRLQALASAHDVLTEAHWTGANLRDLVRSQIAVYAEEKSFELTGSDVFLPAQTALQLALILHELLTNATRFGALARPDGKVLISWETETAELPKVRLTWREVGGPPVTQPQARGFGLTMIERSANLPHVTAQLEFEQSGVVCRVTTDIMTERDPAMFNLRHAANLRSTSEPQACARKSRRVPRALIVTNDVLVSIELEEAFTGAGYIVVGPAASQSAALAFLSGSGVDIAVLDGNVGAEANVAVQRDLDARGIPFVRIAGANGDDPGLNSSSTLTVGRPLDSTALLAAMSTALPNVQP